MGANHKTTRASNEALAAFREACAAEVQDDGEVGRPCWLCRQAIDYLAPFDDWSNPNRFQRDHIKPVSTNPELAEDPANWEASHAGCNIKRGNRPPRPSLGPLSEQFT